MKIIHTEQLDSDQSAALFQLSDLCLKQDPSCSPVAPEEDTVYFLAWEGGELAGALSLALYEDAAPALYLSAATAPFFRRRGIFSALLTQAAAYAEETFAFTENVLPFSCYLKQSCREPLAVLNHLNAYCASKEYFLSLSSPESYVRPLPASIAVERSADLSLLSRLQSGCFGYSPESAAAYIRMLSEEPGLTSYIIRLDGAEAGLFHLLRSPRSVYLTGFGIHPDFRRKGLASSVLPEICRLAQASPALTLQAEDRNVIACHLYLSFGFQIQECLREFRFLLPRKKI